MTRKLKIFSRFVFPFDGCCALALLLSFILYSLPRRLQLFGVLSSNYTRMYIYCSIYFARRRTTRYHYFAFYFAVRIPFSHVHSFHLTIFSYFSLAWHFSSRFFCSFFVIFSPLTCEYKCIHTRTADTRARIFAISSPNKVCKILCYRIIDEVIPFFSFLGRRRRSLLGSSYFPQFTHSRCDGTIACAVATEWLKCVLWLCVSASCECKIHFYAKTHLYDIKMCSTAKRQLTLSHSNARATTVVRNPRAGDKIYFRVRRTCAYVYVDLTTPRRGAPPSEHTSQTLAFYIYCIFLRPPVQTLKKQLTCVCVRLAFIWPWFLAFGRHTQQRIRKKERNESFLGYFLASVRGPHREEKWIKIPNVKNKQRNGGTSEYF